MDGAGSRRGKRLERDTCVHGLDAWSECRECLPGGLTVRGVLAARPDGLTIEEIAELVGVSKQYVDQLEVRALYQLRTGRRTRRDVYLRRSA